MGNISFMTGIDKVIDGKIILDKEYSKKFRLIDGSEITVSSTVGLVRSQQEDSLALSTKGNYKMFLVADGMGGHKAGEIASYYTAKIIKKFFEYEDEMYLRILDDILLNEVVYLLIDEITRKMNRESGTTLSLALVLDDKTYLVNIGDSRIYTLKDDKLVLQTHDDSEAFMRYNPKNSRDRDKLRFYRFNNIVTNGIIKDALVDVNISEIDNDSYDTLCLMTDGVSDILREDEMKECMYQDNPSYEMTELSKNHVVDKVSIEDTDIYKDYDFVRQIEPGKDNASAIVYKKRVLSL